MSATVLISMWVYYDTLNCLEFDCVVQAAVELWLRGGAIKMYSTTNQMRQYRLSEYQCTKVRWNCNVLHDT